jgi:hypothetical protein
VDTDDYAFFAVMAGFQRVNQCQPLREHDPRRAEPDPWASSDALRARLSTLGAQYLIAARSRLPKLAEEAEILLSTEAYALVRLAPKAP